jgi:hypothetical protein
MGLSDFERELASKASEPRKKRERSRSRDRHHSKVRTFLYSNDFHVSFCMEPSLTMWSQHSSKKQHRSSRHHDSSRHEDDDTRRSHKRSRHSRKKDEDDSEERSHHKKRESSRRSPKPSKDEEDDDEDDWVEKGAFDAPPNEDTLDDLLEEALDKNVKRDAWMEAPSSMDVDYIQRRKKEEKPTSTAATRKDYELKVHKNELNQHLRDLQDGKEAEDPLDKPAEHEVSYTFGDSGAAWRMMKLKGVYREAEDSKRSVEDVAIERLGGIREFDDAREEEIELDRRSMYGKDYVGKTKPSGELFEERKLKEGIRREASSHHESGHPDLPQGEVMKEAPLPARTVILDQTGLNKLKANLMRAQLKRDPKAAALEIEYNDAVAAAANRKDPEVVVLNSMDNRMLAGGRKGEVLAVDNTRGRERGLVVENEDMTIEDMVRQERRTRNQGEGMAFAERIAKDAKFDVSHIRYISNSNANHCLIE